MAINSNKIYDEIYQIFKGDPKYKNFGVDDISDWNLAGATSPTFDTDHFVLNDATDLANQISRMEYDTSYNFDGMVIIQFMFQFQSDDDSTDTDAFTTHVRYDDNNDVKIYYDGTAARLLVRMRSGSTNNYLVNEAYSKDTSWHTIQVIAHPSYGVYFYIDGSLHGSDTTITGAHTTWSGTAKLRFEGRHDAGEISNIFVKNIKIEVCPTELMKFNSYGLYSLPTLHPTDGRESEINITRIINNNRIING